MGYYYYGHTCFAGGVLKQLENSFARIIVQCPGRFVAKQKLRIFCQSPCNGNALLLAAGQLSRKVIKSFGKTYLGKSFGGVHRIFAYLSGKGDIFQCGQILYQIIELKNKSDFLSSVCSQLSGRIA